MRKAVISKILRGTNVRRCFFPKTNLKRKQQSCRPRSEYLEVYCIFELSTLKQAKLGTNKREWLFMNMDLINPILFCLSYTLPNKIVHNPTICCVTYADKYIQMYFNITNFVITSSKIIIPFFKIPYFIFIDLCKELSKIGEDLNV